MKKFNGTVAAFDLATVTGWCVGKPDKVPQCGHERFAKPGEPRARAYRRFRLFLDLFCSLHNPTVIIMESAATPAWMAGRTNIDTIKLLMGLTEHLEEWALDRFELTEATTSQVRSHFLGRNLESKIAKQLTVARCREMGWNVATEDEGDAAALWHYQVCILRPDLGVASTPLFGRKM